MRHGLNLSTAWCTMQLISVEKRVEACIQAKGCHSEHLLWHCLPEFQLPHITTGSFQSHRWQPTTDSLHSLQHLKEHNKPSHTHTHLFNNPLSGITPVSRYQKGKINVNFTEAKDSEWQWHQLGHIQVCTSLQADNHASTPLPSFFRPDALPATQPTVSKHWRQNNNKPSVRWKSVASHKLVKWRFQMVWASGFLFVFFWDNVNNQNYVWIILLKMTYLDFPR